MASIPGGTADKSGNSFERLWTVRQLIRVVAGNAVSVTIEALGDDERGTEFWVSRADGTREAHQCKRENGSIGDWSVSDLNNKKVLANAKIQLDRSPTHYFVFVSADKAPSMADLCERALRGDRPDVFCKEAVSTSSGLQSEFKYLCRFLGFDISNPTVPSLVQDYLRRFRVQLADKGALRSEVEDYTGAWLTGDPSEIVAQLESFVSRNETMGRTLGEPEILAALPVNARRRDLRGDVTLPTRIRELGDRFYRSYRHLLIGGQMLGRAETAAIMAKLTAEDGPRLVLVHGPGSTGKTGIIYEIVSKLEAASIPTLPLRLDQDKPADSPTLYGQKLELPASPSACLKALAGEKIGVLILDQLDAIRWTASHSSHAWDTCERMIEEALRYKNLRVVVACRTFDVEDDVRIKGWKKSQQGRIADVKVSGLDDATLQRVLKEAGGSYEALKPEQRRILHSPQSLYLWLELFKDANKPPSFRTTVDLMERFWEFVRRTLPVDPNRLQAVLDALSEDMDRRGLPFSDFSVCVRWTREVDALISANVLNPNGRQLLFCHQSYLDHLTAERVSTAIRLGNTTLAEWVRKDEQSLFRRGQLRQVLALLREQDQERFIQALGELLTAPGVRFHLRHLALQVLANVDIPTLAEIDFVVRLLVTNEWRPHIQRYVVFGREQWFDALCSRGVFLQWMMSSDENLQNQALWIARSVNSSRSDAISSLVLGRGKSRVQRVKYVLWGLDPGLLNNALFTALRGICRLADYDLFIKDWTGFSQRHPQRAILLFKAQIGRILGITRARMLSREDVNHQDRSQLERGDASSLEEAARLEPDFTWRNLMPVLLQTIRVAREFRRSQRADYLTALYGVGQMAGAYQRALFRVLVTAGREMAFREPGKFLEVVASQRFDSSPVLRRIVARSLAALPRERGGDAIKWLLADPKRFRCGGGWRSGRSETVAYAPAVRLLRRFGGDITNDLFEAIQARILQFIPRDEIRNFRVVHDLSYGDAGGWMRVRSLFTAQYVLLSALPRRRLSAHSLDWIGVLGRKLGPVPSLTNRKIRAAFGFVGSTIPTDKIPLISDRQWLNIVGRDWKSRAHRYRQMGPQSIGRVDAGVLSGDLGRVARTQPDRVARLALQFPININPIYIESILRAFGEDKPPEGNAAIWLPVSVVMVEAVLLRFAHISSNTDFAKLFCWMIQKRAKEAWSESTFGWLTTLAIAHPDPPADDGSHEDQLRHVSHVSINSVRGVVAETIGLLLHTRVGDMGCLKSAIDSLLIDSHVAVRAAAIGLAVPFLNDERTVAMEIFLRACDHPDERVLQSRHIDTFLSYVLLDATDQVRPVVERMLRSPNTETSKRGASWVVEVWTHKYLWKDLYQTAISGSLSQKSGAITNLALAILDNRGGDGAVFDLLTFFDDPEKEARDLAASVFRYDRFFQHSGAVAIVNAFIKSKAFLDNIDDFLYGLNDEAVSLRPFAGILAAIAAKLDSTDGIEKRSIRQIYDMGLLAGLLLRLYEQSDGDAVCRGICLDAWDQLLQHGGQEVLEKMDQ